ncbi:hypothetical protein HYC85_009229 [Camellia sinensis]|uniref:Uncharacterized protein n=1 Tax=Camellia sinensis TaxID=4442 RepID=A0A7J7HF98_CAMSI|nr:hypothetical protein HYC85_009229 [Camellia sinensis]
MHGLITTERKGANPAAAPFAKAPGEIEGLGLREGANLVEVPLKFALSGAGSIFNEQMQGTKHNNGKVYPHFELGKAYVFFDKSSALGHARVRFPCTCHCCNVKSDDEWIGVGALLSGARLISDGMSQAVSERRRDLECYFVSSYEKSLAFTYRLYSHSQSIKLDLKAMLGEVGLFRFQVDR